MIFVKYLTGFGNEFASEALPDALPVGQVSLRTKNINLTLTLLFHRSYSTNSVKPKPGAYTACGQNDRKYFI